MGCHSDSKAQVFPIPNAVKLDLTHPGGAVIATKTLGNGVGVITDAHFTNPNNDAYFVSINAHGKGYFFNPGIGGGWCKDAEGADIKVTVTAYYN